jgi:hypothetical protein
MEKVEKVVQRTEAQTANGSLKVAALLRRRRYPTNRRKKEAAMPQLPETQQGGQVTRKPEASYNPNVLPLGVKYAAVIEDLVARRDELDRVIVVLQAFQAKA